MSSGPNLDILFLADVRYEGGASTALVGEIQAASRAGIKTGLMAVKGKLLETSIPAHPDIAALTEQGVVSLVDPSIALSVGLAIIHHPQIMMHRPTRRLRVEARAVVLVLHHPALDASGAEQYDLASIVANCIAAFGQDVALAPVSHAVLASLPKRLPKRSHLVGEEWGNLLDLDQWLPRPPRAPTYPVAIGRHARPDLKKWPDTREEVLLAYPDDSAKYRIRILGGGAFLAKVYGPLPQNWDVEEFRWHGVSSFLQELDFYVYFHSAAWSEAFGRTIMEAMAAQLVVILPPLFESIFGDAAVYCDPDAVKDVIAEFVLTPGAYAMQARRARDFVAEHFGLEQFVPRLTRLFPWLTTDDSTPRTLAGTLLSDERILFMSSNGVGIGHLTQQMAIAERLPNELQPIFVSMSKAIRLARAERYLTHFIPYYRYIAADTNSWNETLAEELFELIAFLRPRLIAFDGTWPYDGLLKALAAHRDILSVWVRRPLWPRGPEKQLPNAVAQFDLIVEPGELADEFDHGPTKPFQNEVFCVSPVLHIDPASRRPRDEARAALGLGPGDLVVAMQLGGGNNYDMTGIRRSLIDEVLAHPQTILLDIRSPIEFTPDKDPYAHPRVRKISLFPAFMDSLAFDAAISAVGYNAFHEQIFGAIPTLFVPNEAPEMDLQLARALYAELNGLGHCARRSHDRYRLKEKVAALLDPATRAKIVTRCQALPYANGAVQIARFISDHARMLRTDYDVTKVE